MKITNENRELIVKIAKLFIDSPYQFWGNGSLPWEWTDCSRFTQNILENVWINIERSSAQQGAQFLESWYLYEDLWKAKVWDLIFFKKTYESENEITHVGIYIGNNKMIHAGTPNVAITTLDSYWKSHFKWVGAIECSDSFNKNLAENNFAKLSGNEVEIQDNNLYTLKAVNAVIAVLTSTWWDLPEKYQELSASYAKSLREEYSDARKLEKNQEKKVYQSLVDFLSYAYKYAWEDEQKKYWELASYLREKFKLK